MAGPPLPAAILTYLTVFRIRSNLAAVGFRASTPLALRPAADRLTGLKLGGLEDPITIATSPFDHTGVVALRIRRRI